LNKSGGGRYLIKPAAQHHIPESSARDTK